MMQTKAYRSRQKAIEFPAAILGSVTKCLTNCFHGTNPAIRTKSQTTKPDRVCQDKISFSPSSYIDVCPTRRHRIRVFYYKDANYGQDVQKKRKIGA